MRTLSDRFDAAIIQLTTMIAAERRKSVEAHRQHLNPCLSELHQGVAAGLQVGLDCIESLQMAFQQGGDLYRTPHVPELVEEDERQVGLFA